MGYCDVALPAMRRRGGGVAGEGGSVRSRRIMVNVGVLAIVALTGCGRTPDRSPTPDVTVTRTMTAAATDGIDAPPASQPQPTQSQAPPPATTQAAIAVPNGVGLNYQQAQDVWRSAGLHVLPAVDATGAHRLPLIDSNWVVLSQDPAAGTTVGPGAFITATVKKYSDG